MDLSTLSGLSPSLLEQLRAVFARYPDVHKVLIYGSRAKGGFTPGSDIDLAVFASDMSSTRFAGLWGALDALPLVFRLDVVHWDRLDNATLKQRIEDEGIELVRPHAPEPVTGA